MISEGLKKIFFISVPIFMLHAIEEYVTLYYKIGFVVKYQWAGEVMSKNDFILFETSFWFVLLLSAFLVKHKRFPLIFMPFFGLIYIYQLEHVVNAALITKNYYPGLVTGTILTILGVWYWRELLKNVKEVYF